MKKFLSASILLLGAAMSAHAAPPISADPVKGKAAQLEAPATAQALLGKWTHESDSEQGRLKQVAELLPQQKFTQHAVYTGAQGKVVADNTASGHWSVKGDRFIRVFTSFNGQKLKLRDQISFQQNIISMSDNEFVTEKIENREKVVFKRSP